MEEETSAANLAQANGAAAADVPAPAAEPGGMEARLAMLRERLLQKKRQNSQTPEVAEDGSAVDQFLADDSKQRALRDLAQGLAARRLDAGINGSKAGHERSATRAPLDANAVRGEKMLSDFLSRSLGSAGVGAGTASGSAERKGRSSKKENVKKTKRADKSKDAHVGKKQSKISKKKDKSSKLKSALKVSDKKRKSGSRKDAKKSDSPEQSLESADPEGEATGDDKDKPDEDKADESSRSESASEAISRNKKDHTKKKAKHHKKASQRNTRDRETSASSERKKTKDKSKTSKHSSGRGDEKDKSRKRDQCSKERSREKKHDRSRERRRHSRDRSHSKHGRRRRSSSARCSRSRKRDRGRKRSRDRSRRGSRDRTRSRSRRGSRSRSKSSKCSRAERKSRARSAKKSSSRRSRSSMSVSSARKGPGAAFPEEAADSVAAEPEQLAPLAVIQLRRLVQNLDLNGLYGIILPPGCAKSQEVAGALKVMLESGREVTARPANLELIDAESFKQLDEPLQQALASVRSKYEAVAASHSVTDMK